LIELTSRPGWSVARLARESGIHRSTIFRWMSGEVRNASTNSVRLIAQASGDDENAALRAASEVLDPTATEPRMDYIKAWEDEIVAEIWANPILPVTAKEELTARARAKAAEARVIEDRLRRTA
jgi:transcriptional regulator with XRE-family HTH domain